MAKKKNNNAWIQGAVGALAIGLGAAGFLSKGCNSVPKTVELTAEQKLEQKQELNRNNYESAFNTAMSNLNSHYDNLIAEAKSEQSYNTRAMSQLQRDSRNLEMRKLRNDSRDSRNFGMGLENGVKTLANMDYRNHLDSPRSRYSVDQRTARNVGRVGESIIMNNHFNNEDNTYKGMIKQNSQQIGGLYANNQSLDGNIQFYLNEKHRISNGLIGLKQKAYDEKSEDGKNISDSELSLMQSYAAKFAGPKNSKRSHRGSYASSGRGYTSR